MGSYPTVYVGPYAICEVTPYQKTVQVRACPSPTCQKPKPKNQWNHHDGAFCETCGTAIEMINIQVEAHPSPYDALGESERLSPVVPDLPARIGMTKGCVYFICNESCIKTPCRFVLESPTHINLDGRDKLNEKTWFEDRYEAELDGLRKEYGNVTIAWGLHYFHS